MLPRTPSGVGLHSGHPLNAGAHVARMIARECLGREQGHAVMVSLSWLPLDTRPHTIHIKNERGDDLTKTIGQERFDLKKIPVSFCAQGYLTRALEIGYRDVELPWEK